MQYAGLKVIRVWRINKEATIFLDAVNDRFVLAHGQGWTAKASSQATIFLDKFRISIFGTMNDDGPFPGTVIDAFFDAVQSQRIAVFAGIGFCGAVEAKAAHIA